MTGDNVNGSMIASLDKRGCSVSWMSLRSIFSLRHAFNSISVSPNRRAQTDALLHAHATPRCAHATDLPKRLGLGRAGSWCRWTAPMRHRLPCAAHRRPPSSFLRSSRCETPRYLDTTSPDRLRARGVLGVSCTHVRACPGYVRKATPPWVWKEGRAGLWAGRARTER